MKLPDGWKYIKLSELFDEVSEKNHSNVEVLTIVQGVGTVPRKDSGRDIIYDKNSLSNYKYVRKDDFIIHLRSFEGGLEIANQEGIVSPAYIILRTKIQAEPGYLYTLFHSNRFINQTMAPSVEGVRDGRSVKYDVLKNQHIPFPPLAEQQKISEILCKQDRIISLKQELLEQKQQQKKWLMQKLLEVPYTNADCEEKFSLGGVVIDKSGWKKCKFMDIAKIESKLVDPRLKEYSSLFLIAPDHIQSQTGIILNKITASQQESISNKFLVSKNDVIYSKIRPYLKKVCLATEKCLCSADMYPFTCSGKIIPKFLQAILLSSRFTTFACSYSARTGIPKINREELSNYYFFLPSLPEQKIIAQVLSTADKEIALLKSSIEQEKQKKKSLAQLLLTGTVRVKI